MFDLVALFLSRLDWLMGAVFGVMLLLGWHALADFLRGPGPEKPPP